jgi:predicted metal-binding membrane protein
MTNTAEDPSLPHPSTAETQARSVLAQPRVVAISCIAVLAAMGWLYLGLMMAGMLGQAEAGAFGPGMGLIELFTRQGTIDLLGRALFETLCRPSFGSASGLMGLSFIADIGLVFPMWCAMALAMMLPTAGPMILTYAELADTAARQGEQAVSPLVLTAGFLSVWFGFAALASLLQIVLSRLALLDPAMASASSLFSGAIFAGAGLYQFSALKEACLTRCQKPFPFFFANWSAEPRAIYRLGVAQGIYCLGCCWATMMVMLAVGLMNVVWMAALGIVMMMEKIATTARLSHAIGAIFIVIGVVFIISSVAAHWPVRSF